MKNILDEINKLIIDDYKSGQSERRVLLQTVKAALLQSQKDSKSPSDFDEEKIIKSEIKQRQQARSQYLENNRSDLVKKMDFEIDVLKEFLPEELTDEQLAEIIKSVIKKCDDKSFGSIMKASMQEVAGRADGSRIVQMVKNLS